MYAGIGLFLWVLFKDRLSPVQNILGSVLARVKDLTTKAQPVTAAGVKVSESVATPVLVESLQQQSNEDKFFKLIVSWKQTRDLAEQCGCSNAVEVADSMFPYLSPNVCVKDNHNA